MLMLAFVSLIVLAAAPAPKSWDFKTGPTPKVSVSNVAGSITIEGTSGDHVMVEATVVGDENSPWIVEARADGNEVKVRACCGSCDEKENCSSNHDQVVFNLKVPEQSALRLKAVSSSVNVRGVKGSESIHSVSGAIEVAGTGKELELHSVSGPIKVSPSAIDNANIHTVSGDVQLKLPASPDVKVRLKTVSGRLNKEGRTLGSTEKVFGKGTKEIDIHTVSGSVETDPTI
jgi:putative adhesin